MTNYRPTRPSRSPRPVRALPKSPPIPDTEPGVSTALVTRIVIAATVLLGQLWALTVALEASLLDHDAQAWLLAAFSLISFVVVLVVTRVDPPSRSSRLRGRASTESGTYVARPVDDGPQ